MELLFCLCNAKHDYIKLIGKVCFAFAHFQYFISFITLWKLWSFGKPFKHWNSSWAAAFPIHMQEQFFQEDHYHNDSPWFQKIHFNLRTNSLLGISKHPGTTWFSCISNSNMLWLPPPFSHCCCAVNQLNVCLPAPPLLTGLIEAMATTLRMCGHSGCWEFWTLQVGTACDLRP